MNNNNIVVGMGEALWDVLPEGKKLGGAPANFAYHVSQFGLNSCVVSAVGDDKLGAEILESFKAKELSAMVETVPYPTGTVQVTLDDAGVPCYDIKEGVAWDNIPFTGELERLAKHTSLVCFGSLAQRHVKSRDTICQFLKTVPDTDKTFKVFDINLRQSFYNKDLIHESLTLCNILKINDEELTIMSSFFDNDSVNSKEQCLALLERYNLKMVILTCGINGSYIITPESVSFRETPQVKIGDTVGAGDSFTATFCSALFYGKNISKAHELAVEVSAYVCSQYGSMPLLPNELKRKVMY